MKLRMDKSGRVVFPKPLRRRLGVERAAELEVIEWPEGILLSPSRQAPVMVRVGGVWVHQGVAEDDSDRQERLLEAMALVRDGDWIGGRIYDAVLLRCAAKANVDRTYTFN